VDIFANKVEKGVLVYDRRGLMDQQN